jgi:nicotinate-nucleotide adenylyltransferase
VARSQRVKRVALFGGTFDPIHVGHLAIAEAARGEARLEEVVFMPARRNPLKEAEPAASAEDRFEMVRLSLYASPGMRASRVELEREGPSYTVETLRAFSRDGVELAFLLGADALRDVAAWREPGAVLALATLLVAKRPGTPDPDLAALRRLSSDARVRLFEAPLVDLSSLELRAHGRAGGSLRYLVPDAAWHYAASRGLYGQRLTEGW